MKPLRPVLFFTTAALPDTRALHTREPRRRRRKTPPSRLCPLRSCRADFQKKMSGAKLVGYFTDDNADPGKLNQETYTISKVTPGEGDGWIFNALVEYGGKSFEFPFAVDVKWAEDTPVITLDRQEDPHGRDLHRAPGRLRRSIRRHLGRR